MEKSKKNPFLSGCLNMLVPGSTHIYIRKEWRKFVLTFVSVELVLAIVIWLGISIQSARYFNLPQGLCPGILALFVLVPLFIAGQRAATEHNKILEDEVLYHSHQPVIQEDDNDQLKRIQKMRDEGLISEQQYIARRSQVGVKSDFQEEKKGE